MGYGEVASDAATLAVPEQVDFKEPKDFEIIGTSQKNVDATKIVQGESLFGIDLKREGMLYAAIVHPPAFGMKLKSVDDTEARTMPGVQDVVTINTEIPGDGRQWSDVNAFHELVAVVGNSTWEVLQAKKALNIEWESGCSTGKHQRSHYQTFRVAG